MTSSMREKAEEQDGQLIWEKSVPAAGGGTTTREVDVTALLTPGRRQTGNVEHLLIEARLYDERDREEWGGNPAYPTEGIVEQAIERIEAEGLEPAWRLVETPGEFP